MKIENCKVELEQIPPPWVEIAPNGAIVIDPKKVFPHMLPRYAELSVAAVLKEFRTGGVNG